MLSTVKAPSLDSCENNGGRGPGFDYDRDRDSVLFEACGSGVSSVYFGNDWRGE